MINFYTRASPQALVPSLPDAACFTLPPRPAGARPPRPSCGPGLCAEAPGTRPAGGPHRTPLVFTGRLSVLLFRVNKLFIRRPRAVSLGACGSPAPGAHEAAVPLPGGPLPGLARPGGDLAALPSRHGRGLEPGGSGGRGRGLERGRRWRWRWRRQWWQRWRHRALPRLMSAARS